MKIFEIDLLEINGRTVSQNASLSSFKEPLRNAVQDAELKNNRDENGAKKRSKKTRRGKKKLRIDSSRFNKQAASFLDRSISSCLDEALSEDSKKVCDSRFIQ